MFTHSDGECNVGIDSCIECWVRSRIGNAAWESATRLPAAATAAINKRHWLMSRISESGEFVGIGCNVCFAFLLYRHRECKSTIGGKLPNSFGACSVKSNAGLQISHLRRHSQSTWHSSAIAWAIGDQASFMESFGQYAPTEIDFRALWNHIKAGNSRQHVPTVGARLKLRRMSWCLAEAIRTAQWSFLRRCATIAVYLDKKGGDLSMRFTAATEDLDTACGYVGSVASYGGHLSVIESSIRILQDFSTPGLGRPSAAHEERGTRPPPAVLESLFDELKSKIEFHASDAEGAMTLASRKFKSVFPNTKAGQWDLAHGFRRILSRPWVKDAVIRHVVQTIVTGKSSIVRLVQNSPEFASWYRRHKSRSTSDIGPRVVNFSFAAHRFDSTSKPLGRAILGLVPLIRTAMQIVRLRRGQPEALHAAHFLSFITTQRIVLMAMCADAADEANTLLRFVDKEVFAVEEVPEQCRLFLQKIELLFVGGRCRQSGYTQWVLEALKHPVMFYVDGHVRVVGNKSGVAESCVQRCLERLAKWSRVARTVVAAEYQTS